MILTERERACVDGSESRRPEQREQESASEAVTEDLAHVSGLSAAPKAGALAWEKQETKASGDFGGQAE